MRLLALGTPLWIALGALLLFALLVVLTYALSLAKEAKRAAESFSVASARLRSAAAELQAQAQEVAERAGSAGRGTRPAGEDRPRGGV